MFWPFGRKSKVVSPTTIPDSVANNSIIQEAMRSMGPTKLPSPYIPYTPNLNLPAPIAPKKKEETKEKTKYSELDNSSDNTAVYTAIGAAALTQSYWSHTTHNSPSSYCGSGSDNSSSSSCDGGGSSGSSGCD